MVTRTPVNQNIIGIISSYSPTTNMNYGTQANTSVWFLITLTSPRKIILLRCRSQIMMVWIYTIHEYFICPTHHILLSAFHIWSDSFVFLCVYLFRHIIIYKPSWNLPTTFDTVSTLSQQHLFAYIDVLLLGA